MTWLLSNMVWASAAMLLVLAIRRPFAACFGAGPAYALWLLPALRFVMPPLPAWGAVELPTLIPPPTVILVAEDMAAPMPPSGGPGQWVPLLLAIWAVGAAAFLLWQAWSYRRFVGALRRDARDRGTHRGVRLIESGAVEGPISFGLLRRRIAVPADFESRYSPEERALALDHEAVHHRRLDLWWNHLGLLILALNWFNPVVWFAFRAFRADQELACDAAVAATADPGARHDYACALVKSASRPGLIAACPLNHADQLKRRLKMMKFHKPGRLRMLGGAAAIAALGGLGLALGSGGAIAQAGGQKQATPPAPPSTAAPRDGDDTRVIVRTIRTEEHRTRSEGEGARSEPRAGAGEERREERRITVVTRNGEGSEGRRIRIEGPDGQSLSVPEECENGRGRTEVAEGDTNNRTRIILCSRSERSPAQQAESLQRARERLAGDSQIPAEHRQRVLAAIDREIARLRGQ
ncbi:MAG TPA: M56 family metallopeptidase [Allosphingosinicella sp.]|nr:M56 family metallopeptidase [Allosphingosinicella sp.]